MATRGEQCLAKVVNLGTNNGTALGVRAIIPAGRDTIADRCTKNDAVQPFFKLMSRRFMYHSVLKQMVKCGDRLPHAVYRVGGSSVPMLPLRLRCDRGTNNVIVVRIFFTPCTI
jgi:hypothetical protein